MGTNGSPAEAVRRSTTGCRASRSLSGDRAAQIVEQAQLEFEDAFVGTENFLLVLLQRRRDETLAAGDRLFAMVIGRDGVEIRL